MGHVLKHFDAFMSEQANESIYALYLNTNCIKEQERLQADVGGDVLDFEVE